MAAIAALLQRGVALQVGGRLREARGRGGKLGLGALDLQLEVPRIEPRDDVADAHAVADIDDARDDLAADAEPEIGLVAGAHDADELAGHGAGLERDPLHLHRALRLRRGRGLRLAGGEQQSGARRQRSDERQAAGTLATSAGGAAFDSASERRGIMMTDD